MRGDPPVDRGIDTPRHDTIRLLRGDDARPILLGHLPIRKDGYGSSSELRQYSLEDPGVQKYWDRVKASPVPCEFAAETFTPGGLVFGASGFGKSRFIKVLADGWTSGGDYPGMRHLNLIDPKSETHQIFAIDAAHRYLTAKDDEERRWIVDQIHVNDVLDDRFTPANLFDVPFGMRASLVADVRANTALEAFRGESSELIEHGIRVLFHLATSIGAGMTIELVRAVMGDAHVRERILLPRIADEFLRERLRSIETTLPEQTRAAVIRRFEVLLADRTARLLFGMSPWAFRLLTGRPRHPSITLQNFGPSLVRAPHVAIAQAMNAVVTAITDSMVREEVLPEMLVTEETGQLVRNSTVARYILDASRTLRWKGIALVCCVQDPTNAMPADVLHTIVLNARWLAAFQSLPTDAALFDPYLPTSSDLYWHNLHVGDGLTSVSQSKRAFYTRMASLPQQHLVFVRKGLSAFLMKTQTLIERATSPAARSELLDVFYRHVAAPSMVRYCDAEDVVADETQRLLAGDLPVVSHDAEGAHTVEDFFARADHAWSSGRAGRSS